MLLFEQCWSTAVPQNITFAQSVNTDLYTVTSISITETVFIPGVQVNGYIFPNPTATSSSNPVEITLSPTVTPSNTGRPGLSSGAKASIGAGVALGVIALVTLGAVALLFRRKRQAANAAPVINPEFHEVKQELADVGERPAHELEARGHDYELSDA